MAPRLPDSRVDDAAPDDWLGEEGDVEWGDEPDAVRGVRREEDLAATARVSTGRADPEDAEIRRRVVARRRAIALLGLLALAVVGVVVGLSVFGDEEPAGPTAPAATTQPPATQPPATPPPAATTSPGTGSATLTVTLPESGPLAEGATGEEVETLQTALAALGLDPGEVDGDFGAATEEAVIAFQQANDLPADGIVGPATVEKLNAVLAEQGITG